MTTFIDKVSDIVVSTYKQMYPEEARTAGERGQRIRRTEERVIQEKPGYQKWINKIKENNDINKYGIPVGAEVVDKEEGYEEDEQPREPRSGSQMIFDYTAIGGDQSRGGKTKFRLWLENTFIAQHPDLKEKIDGVSGKTKRNMMRSISFVVRRNIAQKGLAAGWVKGGAGTWE